MIKCLLLGHDWIYGVYEQVSTHGGYRERICRRCGRHECAEKWDYLRDKFINWRCVKYFENDKETMVYIRKDQLMPEDEQ